MVAKNPDISRSPTVLQVLPDLTGYGGVEIETLDVARALVGAGWNALVAAKSAGWRDADAGVIYADLPMQEKGILAVLRNARLLEHLIRKHGVHLVHARSRGSAWSAWIAARRTGIKFVTTVHGSYRDGPLCVKRFYNSVMARGEQVAVPSRYIEDYVSRRFRIPSVRIRRIDSGINLEAFSPERVNPDTVQALRKQWDLTKAKSVVLLPGRLSRIKGHSIMLSVLALLPETVHCLFVGGHPSSGYLSELYQKIELLGLQERVHFAGEWADMPAAYMLADVVVVPSVRAEAFARVVIEAQAMGRMVVASNHGGPQETIRDGETGWLVVPSDIQGLAERLAMVLALSAEERNRIASAAMAFSRTMFNAEKMRNSTLDLYRNVLECSS